jgi:hypothetical protein
MTKITMAQRLLSRSVRGVFRRSSYLISPTPAISTFSVTSLQGSAPTLHSQSITKPLSNTDRSFSSYNANPSYQIYGENTAFTMKSIMPGFKIVGSKTVIVDNNKKGRLLLEFTPRTSSEGRFAWDQAIKFALSAEEVGTLLSRLSNSHTVEFARQTGQSGNPQYGFHNEDMGQGTLQKVFRAIPNPDGTVQFSIDYELEGRGGQDPPNPQESVSRIS